MRTKDHGYTDEDEAHSSRPGGGSVGRCLKCRPRLLEKTPAWGRIQVN